jgi:hypothetical protein
LGKSILVCCCPLLKCRALRDDTPNAMIARNGNVVVMTALINTVLFVVGHLNNGKKLCMYLYYTTIKTSNQISN